MNIRKKFSAQFMLVTVFILYKAEISSLNKQISSTKKQIEELKKIENGNTSEDLETIARNRLNMVKPNEIVYIDIGKEGK